MEQGMYGTVSLYYDFYIIRRTILYVPFAVNFLWACPTDLLGVALEQQVLLALVQATFP